MLYSHPKREDRQQHTHHEYPPPRHQELRIFIPLIFDGVTFAIENQKDVRKSSPVEGSRSNGASSRVVAKQEPSLRNLHATYVRIDSDRRDQG